MKEENEIIEPKEELTGIDKTPVDLDSIIESYAATQEGETVKESAKKEPTVKVEETEIDLRPKKTRKKSGRKVKSADSEIDSEGMIMAASMILGAIIHALLERATKKQHERGEFYLTDSEVKMIAPFVDKVVSESLTEMDPKTVLIIMLFGIYAGKILPALIMGGE